MNIIRPTLCGISLMLAGASLGPAQDATTHTMPKVILLQREWIKPGKAGAIHDKSEAAFVQAMTRNKFPTHYIALNSVTGKSRALFISPYESFASLEKDNQTIEKNASLAADIDHATLSDGELLDGYDQALFTFDEDLSYKPKPDISHARYIEVTSFLVKPGHRGEFMKATKLVKEAHERAGTSAHWAMYEIAYGADDGTFIALSADSSMAEIDTGFAETKKWLDAMGEDGMKKLDELAAAGSIQLRSELFSINPKQSYADEAWIKADPGFWKPKAKAAPESAATKPAAKPAPATAKPASR